MSDWDRAEAIAAEAAAVRAAILDERWMSCDLCGATHLRRNLNHLGIHSSVTVHLLACDDCYRSYLEADVGRVE